MDSSDPDQPASPIYYVEAPGGDTIFRPRTATLGEMISRSIEAFDDGAFGYDAAADRWSYDYQRLDPARELTRLV